MFGKRLYIKTCLNSLLAALLLTTPFPLLSFAQKSQQTKSPRVATRSLTVQTEPNATIWIDDLRYGSTDATGTLTLKKVPSVGRHILRVRARGFAERRIPLLQTGSAPLKLKLVRTTNKAELTFQEAEELREKATTEEMRKQAVETYRRAISLNPKSAAAYVGLARTLLDLSEIDKALEAIAQARRYRPSYSEASAVEGRIHRATADTKAAIESFKRAIREGRGYQPEAYTGLGLAYEDEGNFEETVKAFEKAIQQLYDTEPVVYQLLGAAYEKLENYKKAVAAYEKYLELAPNGKLAPAIQSMVEQLKIQASGQGLMP
jgi:tetratricopeptide (TPR) repeat protein